MYVQLLSFMLFVASFLRITEAAWAGKIEVTNENKRPLMVEIRAERERLEEDVATYIQKIPADLHSTFTVGSTALKGKTSYSIKGDGSLFTGGDKCNHLSVSKDYRVTFWGDATGTSCLAEEIR